MFTVKENIELHHLQSVFCELVRLLVLLVYNLQHIRPKN
jgi:hypothetical protein